MLDNFNKGRPNSINYAVIAFFQALSVRLIHALQGVGEITIQKQKIDAKVLNSASVFTS